MAFWSTRKCAADFHDTLHAPLHGSDAWATEPEPEKRDWKKIVLIAGLATLSWVATYVGMLELIQSNMGSLPLLHKAIIAFSVAMLMTMIVWLLDQIFSPIDTVTKLTYVAGYIFLTLISVGFSFGFYWKVLESRAEAARSATSAVGQVQSSLHGASTRLEQLQATLLQLSTVSHQKAELERLHGTSCPNSSPGDGPRRKMRDEDAARFSFASDFVKGRVGAIKGDMAALDAELAKIVADDPSIVDPKTGTRNALMRALGRRLDMTVTGFNAFRTDLADRAERTMFPDGRGGTIACPDAQLQIALHSVVRAIYQLPTLEKPEIAAVEGSEATIEAFRRLTATFYGLLSFKLPPSADVLRALQQRAVQSIEDPSVLRALNEEAAGLSKRDYIPLGTAIFVDLCLLLVSIGRPMNRFVATRQHMIEAERGEEAPSARPPKPRGRASGLKLPGHELQEEKPGEADLRAAFKHRPGARAPEKDEAPPRHGARTDFRQRFGSYANHAQAELATYRHLDEDDAAPVDAPANGNTAPNAAAKGAQKPEDIVVPFPAARPAPGGRTLTPPALAERLSAALAAVEKQTPVDPSDTPAVDVALTRETATFRLPVSSASLPTGLVRLARATATSNATESNGTDTDQLLTLPALGTAATAPSIAQEVDEAHDGADGATFQPPRILRK
jgi:hypothetical protein